MRLGRGTLCTWTVFAVAATAAGSEPATITGRVFDQYHRPVAGAQVVPMERRIESGNVRLVPGMPQAIIDATGMYRLTVPPGRYTLAVTPPPKPLDFATVFPAYPGDIVDVDKASAVEVRSGELRPSVDFLLLEVESHRVSGKVSGISSGAAVAVSLYSASGYTGPLRTMLTDTHGNFSFDRIPAGAYVLKAAGPVTALKELEPQLGASAWYGSIHLDVRAPEISGVQIQLRAGAR